MLKLVKAIGVSLEPSTVLNANDHHDRIVYATTSRFTAIGVLLTKNSYASKAVATTVMLSPVNSKLFLAASTTLLTTRCKTVKGFATMVTSTIVASGIAQGLLGGKTCQRNK